MNHYALAVGRRLQMPLELAHALGELLDPLTLDSVQAAHKKISAFSTAFHQGNKALPKPTPANTAFLRTTKLHITEQVKYAADNAHNSFKEKAVYAAYFAVNAVLDLFDEPTLDDITDSDLLQTAESYLNQAMFWLDHKE